VRFVAKNHLSPPVTVGKDGDEISHGSARYYERRLLSKNRCRFGFQVIDGRIFFKNVIPQFCIQYRLTHGIGRKGNGIASQIDSIHIISPFVKTKFRSDLPLFNENVRTHG
jgi:hypothetical protein